MRQLDELIGKLELQIRQWACQDEAAKRLQQIPGVGPITASALEIYIVRLRKKLENTGAQIVTLRGLGYMLTHVAA